MNSYAYSVTDEIRGTGIYPPLRTDLEIADIEMNISEQDVYKVRRCIRRNDDEIVNYIMFMCYISVNNSQIRTNI